MAELQSLILLESGVLPLSFHQLNLLLNFAHFEFCLVHGEVLVFLGLLGLLHLSLQLNLLLLVKNDLLPELLDFFPLLVNRVEKISVLPLQNIDSFLIALATTLDLCKLFGQLKLLLMVPAQLLLFRLELFLHEDERFLETGATRLRLGVDVPLRSAELIRLFQFLLNE